MQLTRAGGGGGGGIKVKYALAPQPLPSYFFPPLPQKSELPMEEDKYIRCLVAMEITSVTVVR